MQTYSFSDKQILIFTESDYDTKEQAVKVLDNLIDKYKNRGARTVFASAIVPASSKPEVAFQSLYNRRKKIDKYIYYSSWK